MPTGNLIAADEFCAIYNIEYSFISTMHEYGLVETTIIEQKIFIQTNNLKELEKLIRLHYELDINFEGIQAIAHLLQRVDGMQKEIAQLKSRLGLYETHE